MNKHTPGEWSYDDGHIFTNEPNREYNSIARLYDIYDNNGNAESNIQIILLSPKLVEINKYITAKIEDTIKQHDYIFRNREDFVESRTNWEGLSNIANDFYYLLLEIKDKIDLSYE